MDIENDEGGPGQIFIGLDGVMGLRWRREDRARAVMTRFDEPQTSS
jgi:hypothetical protein